MAQDRNYLAFRAFVRILVITVTVTMDGGNKYMPDTSVSKLAYYLALIGGIIMVIFGLLSFIGYSLGAASFLHLGWGLLYSGSIVTIICGVIAVVGARSASTLVWAIVLIVVGLVGQGLGGLLVLLGGIIGLVVVLSKKS